MRPPATVRRSVLCSFLIAAAALEMACGPKCEGGKQASGRYCCWPGQSWSDVREACVGRPKCPAGSQARAGGCLGPAPRCPAGMVGIGAASVHLGSNRSGDEVRGARPLYEARLEAFCIDRTEVTVEEYKRCVDAGKCSPPLSGDPSGGDFDEAMTLRERAVIAPQESGAMFGVRCAKTSQP